VVEAIRARIEKEVGPSVTATQVVLKWINQKGIVSITFVLIFA
jgi:diketogulonate reductase-like aldo/keto reductase